MSEKALLEVKDLKTYFYTEEGVTPAVDGLSFTLQDGGTLAIVGESGCGKSVTSLSILRIFPSPPGKIVGGDILYKGESLLKKSEKEMRKIRGNEISMIFQEPLTSLNPVFTVGQQICETLKMHQGLNKKQAREKGIEMLKKVGIPTPEKVIDDEPTTALDVTIQAQILKLLGDLKKEMNTAIILITHDLGIVAQIAQNVMVMYAGQAVEYADVRTLFKNTLHPYTLGLLKSIPVIGDDKDSLFSIKGSIPSAKDYPKGCRFCPRCDRAMGKCMNEAPELTEAEPGHWVRCWLYEGGKNNG